MRVIAIPVALATLGMHAVPAAAEPAAAVAVAVYWEPPGKTSLGATARAAFADSVKLLGARLVDAATPASSPAPLAPLLERAKADYVRFAFVDAIGRLDELVRTAGALGGGELDGRQLSEIFLYRGLCRLETGNNESAWDDLVRAARIDPTRLMDEALYPPRAVAAYNRAVAEVAKLPRAELDLRLPAHAAVRVDGAAVAGSSPIAVTLGQHFVSVSVEGYEPWADVVSVSGARERVVPPLRPYRSPDGDRLLALAADPAAKRLIEGALERTDAGWRFVLRDVTLPGGKLVSDSAPLGDSPEPVVVDALVRRLIGPAPTPPPRRPWWPWFVGGASAAAAAATVVSIGVVYGIPSSSGTVGGALGNVH